MDAWVLRGVARHRLHCGDDSALGITTLGSAFAVSRRVQQIGPMSAGLNVQSTTGLDGLPLQPGVGLIVTVVWAAVSLAAGAVVLHRQDA